MTPSYSYPSSPPSSMKIFLACKLLLVPSLTGWLHISSASTVLKPNFCYLVKPQLNKIDNPALTLSNGASVCPSPSARNLGFIFDAHLTFSIIFLHLLARASTTSGISDAFALSLTSVQPTSLAHHSYTQSSITSTHYTMAFQKNPVNWSPAYPELSCSCRCCSSQVFWS